MSIKNIISTEGGISVSVLRILVGVTFFQAGIGKLFGWSSYGGGAVTKSYFEQIGNPAPEISLMVVGTIELLAGSLLIVGLFTRIASFPLFILMYVAILTVHRVVGYSYPLFIYCSAAVLMQHGSGPFSLDTWLNKRIKT